MGRQRTIDRGALLDAAERVVLRDGAAHLTIEAVAVEAGVSKGGVLYAFATKDALVDALFTRTFAIFDDYVRAHMEQAGDSQQNRVTAHVLASRDATDPSLARMAALTANFMRSPDYRQHAIGYYQDLLGNLAVDTERGRRARLALLACEGAFMLHGFDLWPGMADTWIDIHQDILDLLLS